MSSLKISLNLILSLVVLYSIYSFIREYEYILNNDTLNYRISSYIISSSVLCKSQVEAYTEKNGNDGPNCKNARKKLITGKYMLTLDIMLDNMHSSIKPGLNKLYLVSWFIPIVLAAIVLFGFWFFGKYVFYTFTSKFDILGTGFKD